MSSEYTTIRVLKETSKNVKIVSLATGETADHLVARLIKDELRRIKPELTRVIKESGVEYKAKSEK